MINDKSTFLNKYDSVSVFSDADSCNGQPILITAEKDSKNVIIKFWPQIINEVDNDLEDIWLYEIRQLHRLKGYPGVGDYISLILDSGRDDAGYYLVLDTGNRLPLPLFLKEPKVLSLRSPWIRSLKDPGKRVRFWRNIIRLVNAVRLLHSQGLLHRHLDENSILTDLSSDEADFQLTGFEWSIRVQAISQYSNVSYQANQESLGNTYSFLSDWADLGYLISSILKLNIDHVRDPSFPIETIVGQSGLSIKEITFIRALIGLIKINSNVPREALNGDLIETEILNIVEMLERLGSKKNGVYNLVFSFNTLNNERTHKGKPISVFSAVRGVYKDKFGITLAENNIDECMKFIKQDIGDASEVIFIPSGEKYSEEFLLMGLELSYILKKKKRDRLDSEGSWESAFCSTVYIEPPKKINWSNKSVNIKRHELNCVSLSESKVQLSNIVLNSWESLISELRCNSKIMPSHQALIDGFSAYHLTEIAYARSEIYPVELLKIDSDPGDAHSNIVQFASRIDEEIEALSKSLGLRSPALRLQQLLVKDEAERETISWTLVSGKNFTEEEQDIVLDFQSAFKLDDGEQIYEFITTSRELDCREFFIIPSSVQGTISQLSRRANSIDALANHAELMGMLSDPYQGITKSQETHQEHTSFHRLDESKKMVFKSVLNTMPLYLVQGPPGVGKTYLVTTLIQQIFAQEPDSRVLLTSQSHSTVQHLYQEVIKTYSCSASKIRQPLIISCIKSDLIEEDANDTLYELDRQAKYYLNELINSDLFKKSSADMLKEKVIGIHNNSSRSTRYSLIIQLLKAANMVFATTNSKQVEDLIKARSQFDWSIMEETGKTTGIELLSPMLLSYRRLMIGDHKQLPPYRSEEMGAMLNNPAKLQGALKVASEVHNNLIKGESVKGRFDDEFIESLTTEKLKELGSEASRLHLLFESLIEEELQMVKKSFDVFGTTSNHRPIASMLSLQHRMHPDISGLISKVFYNNELKTADEKIEYYSATSSNQPFHFVSSDILQSSSAITWIDIPDVQTLRNFNQGDEKPRWHNTLEREVVISILKSLRVRESANGMPKLAILSPYAYQISRLAKDIQRHSNSLENNLEHLSRFSTPDDHSTFCSTVDGFQGAEADVVIVSLVRNNAHSYSQSALGFLLDSRRMNVLLSRAKHKLILVGSFQFLQNWADKIRRETRSSNYQQSKFLIDLIDALNEYEKVNRFTKINYNEISDLKKDSMHEKDTSLSSSNNKKRKRS